MWREGVRKAVALLLALCVLGVVGGGATAPAGTEPGYLALKAASAAALAPERKVPGTALGQDTDGAPPQVTADLAAAPSASTRVRYGHSAAGSSPGRELLPEARAPPRSLV